MHKLILLSLAAFGLAPASYADRLPGPIPAEVIRVVDGDTIKVRAMIWVDQTVEVSVRLRGIDAPELFRPKCSAEKSLGYSAKQAVSHVAPVGSQITLSEVTRDKYGGRVVATVGIGAGKTLGGYLLANGQAIVMGDKKPWCGV